LNEQDFSDTVFLMATGVPNHIKRYQTQTFEKLVSNLETASNDTVVLFIPGIIFGILIAITIGMIIYKVLWRERQEDSRTLQILPVDLVMNNRNLKAYLIKESNKFYKFVKKYEN